MSDVAPSAGAGIDSPGQSIGRHAPYIFWIMFFINLLNYMDRYVFTGAANVIGHELHLSLDQIGFIASAFLVVYTLATLPLGAWADRAKRKNVIAICVALWSIVTALTALANSFLTLFLTRMILGIGEAGYYPAGTALLSDCYQRSRRAQIMSRWTVGSVVGLMIGFIMGGEVAGIGFGYWRYAFLFTGIPGLILAFLVWRMHEPRRNQADEEAFAANPEEEIGMAADTETFHTIVVPKDFLRQLATLLRIRTMVVLIMMQVFAFYALGAGVSFLPIYLQQKDTLDLSSGTASLLSGGVIVVAGIVGLFIGGYLADALSRRYPGARILVSGIGFLLSAPAYALTVLIHQPIGFVICFFITVVMLYIYNGPSTAATQDVAPAALRASAVAISLLIAHLLGDAFAPSIIGVLATAFDPTHGQHFANNVAGGDLSLAFLVTCVPVLIIAGLIGIFGARWMKGDVIAAQRADRLMIG
ncbi:MAG TPA: MFS transporter [Ktedonobacteraceae bacterium]|nr:MFS transporter [Ktedonobacteraceae bacterium]